MNRDGSLEAAIAHARHEDAPWLVYGDWLAERGEDQQAAAFHVLGGRTSAEPTPRTREVLALALATGLWTLHEQFAREAGQAHDDFLANSNDVPRALSQFAQGVPVVWPKGLEPRFASLNAAMAALDRGAFADAARAARTIGDPHRWLRLFRCAAAIPEPFVQAQALALELMELGPITDEVLRLRPTSGFSFEHVMVTNATVGIEGHAMLSPRSAREGFLGLALNMGGGYDHHELEGALVVDVLEDATGWVARNPFDSLSELYSLLAGNEGHGVAIAKGRERELLEWLEELGPCLGGASSSSDFPFGVMQFERGLVAFHFVY